MKPYYGHLLSQIGAVMASKYPQCNVESVHQGQEDTTITFSKPVMTSKGMGDIVFDFKIPVSNYTFNVPLTFALVFALYLYFKWKKRYLIEASAMLVGTHLLYIYSFCSLHLLKFIVNSQDGIVYGIIPPSIGVQYFFEFLWAFTDNMIIRFEPFLMAVYLWLRSKDFGQFTIKDS